jgi:hypothetical protein
MTHRGKCLKSCGCSEKQQGLLVPLVGDVLNGRGLIPHRCLLGLLLLLVWKSARPQPYKEMKHGTNRCLGLQHHVALT